jgi:hypothetical protein
LAAAVRATTAAIGPVLDIIDRDRPMMSAATTFSAISRARSGRPPTMLTVLARFSFQVIVGGNSQAGAGQLPLRKKM